LINESILTNSGDYCLFLNISFFVSLLDNINNNLFNVSLFSL